MRGARGIVSREPARGFDKPILVRISGKSSARKAGYISWMPWPMEQQDHPGGVEAAVRSAQAILQLNVTGAVRRNPFGKTWTAIHRLCYRMMLVRIHWTGLMELFAVVRE